MRYRSSSKSVNSSSSIPSDEDVNHGPRRTRTQRFRPSSQLRSPSSSDSCCSSAASKMTTRREQNCMRTVKTGHVRGDVVSNMNRFTQGYVTSRDLRRQSYGGTITPTVVEMLIVYDDKHQVWYLAPACSARRRRRHHQQPDGEEGSHNSKGCTTAGESGSTSATKVALEGDLIRRTGERPLISGGTSADGNNGTNSTKLKKGIAHAHGHDTRTGTQDREGARKSADYREDDRHNIQLPSSTTALTAVETDTIDRKFVVTTDDAEIVHEVVEQQRHIEIAGTSGITTATEVTEATKDLKNNVQGKGLVESALVSARDDKDLAPTDPSGKYGHTTALGSELSRTPVDVLKKDHYNTGISGPGADDRSFQKKEARAEGAEDQSKVRSKRLRTTWEKIDCVHLVKQSTAGQSGPVLGVAADTVDGAKEHLFSQTLERERCNVTTHPKTGKLQEHLVKGSDDAVPAGSLTFQPTDVVGAVKTDQNRSITDNHGGEHTEAVSAGTLATVDDDQTKRHYRSTTATEGIPGSDQRSSTSPKGATGSTEASLLQSITNPLLMAETSAIGRKQGSKSVSHTQHNVNRILKAGKSRSPAENNLRANASFREQSSNPSSCDRQKASWRGQAIDVNGSIFITLDGSRPIFLGHNSTKGEGTLVQRQLAKEGEERSLATHGGVDRSNAVRLGDGKFSKHATAVREQMLARVDNDAPPLPVDKKPQHRDRRRSAMDVMDGSVDHGDRYCKTHGTQNDAKQESSRGCETESKPDTKVASAPASPYKRNRSVHIDKEEYHCSSVRHRRRPVFFFDDPYLGPPVATRFPRTWPGSETVLQMGDSTSIGNTHRSSGRRHRWRLGSSSSPSSSGSNSDSSNGDGSFFRSARKPRGTNAASRVKGRDRKNTSSSRIHVSARRGGDSERNEEDWGCGDDDEIKGVPNQRYRAKRRISSKRSLKRPDEDVGAKADRK